MHILLTGAFGFVGINLLRRLASQPNVTVAAADLRAPDSTALAFLAPVLDRVRVLPLDVTERGAVKSAVEREQPSHIIHAAALTPSQAQERANPTAIVDVNLNGVVHVLEAVRTLPSVERVLVVSSSGVYGPPPAHAPERQPEEGPLALEGLYAITKYSAELLAARYAQLGTQMITAVRLPPVYGPMEQPSPSRPRISQVGALLMALAAGQPVKVASPHVSRDWTHTDDIAGAIWALLVAKQWSYPVYNVSYGAALSFRTVVETFMQHGLQAEWVDDPAAADISLPSNLARLPLDIRRLQTDTNFIPRVSFAEGVARLVEGK